jgi:hypothetical protein
MLQGSASLFLGDWTVVFRCQKLPALSVGQLVFLSPWLRTYLEDIPDICGYIPDTCGYILMIAKPCLKESHTLMLGMMTFLQS